MFLHVQLFKIVSYVNQYKIYVLLQRGAGKSTPHACLENNTTWDLIDDIEKLREHLKIPEWQVLYLVFSCLTNVRFIGSYRQVRYVVLFAFCLFRSLVALGEVHLLLLTVNHILTRYIILLVETPCTYNQIICTSHNSPLLV